MKPCVFAFAGRVSRVTFPLILAATLFVSGAANAIQPGAKPTFAVLGPLDLTTPQQFSAFDTALAEAKNIGVEAVSIDVWIGKVQPTSPNSFDWSYYDNVFGRIKNAGLKIIPILAFHKCGGGPGDDCDVKMPSWVFNLAPDMLYKSANGNFLDDSIAVWATDEPAVLAAYENFYKTFGTHFSGMARDFVEINISLGPTGELRYPSYNKNDGWDYDTNSTGIFQFYSDRAGDEFRDYALGLVGNDLSALNARWGTNLGSVNEIRVPQNPDQFIAQRDYETTQYGRDLIDWYNNSLVEHGDRLLKLAHAALSSTLPSLPLGMKIPGVHWQIQIQNTSTPRIAEITAGLVQTTKDLRTVPEARRDAFGYEAILDMIADVKSKTGRDVVLHFTAAEMDNDPPSCQPPQNNTSLAEALVFWISHGASDRDITHKIENALGCVGDPEGGCDNRSWERIANVFHFAPYSGISFLRLATQPDMFGCLPWNLADRQRYAEFIQTFKNHRMVGVHLSEWEPCVQDDGCNYYVLTFENGKPANALFGLHYEGPQATGGQICRHWWTGVVANVPDGFKFTANHITGTNEVWEGQPGQFDRTYSPNQHGDEIFALGGQNTTVFTTRPPCP